MNDNVKAAGILRQYAGELYQGHTIGGEWDGEQIKAEHDELVALADRLALADAGGAVAWLDGPKNGLLLEPDDLRGMMEWAGIGDGYDECDAAALLLWVGEMTDDDGEVTYGLNARNEEVPEEGSWFVRALPRPAPTDSGRVAELEAQLARVPARAEHVIHAQADRIAALEQQLTESREREARMREAATIGLEWTRDYASQMSAYAVGEEARAAATRIEVILSSAAPAKREACKTCDGDGIVAVAAKRGVSKCHECHGASRTFGKLPPAEKE